MRRRATLLCLCAILAGLVIAGCGSSSEPKGLTIAGPGLHVLKAEPQFVERAHARGHAVFVWTVDDLRDVEYVLDLGVDTIITDYPAEVRRLLDER